MAILQNKFYISIEFAILCLVLPSYIWMTNSGNQMFLFLWLATFYTVIIWWRTGNKNTKLFIRIKNEWQWCAVNWLNLKPMLFRWLVATALIFIFTWQFETEKLFYIPKYMPELIPVLATMYTAFSALPQEFIFCSFFMMRYGKYLDNNLSKIIFSALVFAYAHMLFLNWIAPMFSFFGGVIFAYTYLRTRSLALVTIEHGLYGNSIFIIGLGYYFYSGDNSILEAQ